MRQIRNEQREAALAEMNASGLRGLKQAKVTVGATSEATYTVTEPTTRRVIVATFGMSNGDIRLAVDQTADGNSFPLMNASYFPVDAWSGPPATVIHFFNASAGSLDVYVFETE